MTAAIPVTTSCDQGRPDHDDDEGDEPERGHAGHSRGRPPGTGIGPDPGPRWPARYVPPIITTWTTPRWSAPTGPGCRSTHPTTMPMGHEYCGEIVEYGPDTARAWPVGNLRITATPALFTPDGLRIIGMAIDAPGGFGEYFLVSEGFARPVPESVPPENLALIDAMAVGWYYTRIGVAGTRTRCHWSSGWAPSVYRWSSLSTARRAARGGRGLQRRQTCAGAASGCRRCGGFSCRTTIYGVAADSMGHRGGRSRPGAPVWSVHLRGLRVCR